MFYIQRWFKEHDEANCTFQRLELPALMAGDGRRLVVKDL